LQTEAQSQWGKKVTRMITYALREEWTDCSARGVQRGKELVRKRMLSNKDGQQKLARIRPNRNPLKGKNRARKHTKRRRIEEKVNYWDKIKPIYDGLYVKAEKTSLNRQEGMQKNENPNAQKRPGGGMKHQRPLTNNVEIAKFDKRNSKGK